MKTMTAANSWVQIKVEDKKVGFSVDGTLLEGKVISIGKKVEHIKKGVTVLFPALHGKVMEHSVDGTKLYFVDESVILATE